MSFTLPESFALADVEATFGPLLGGPVRCSGRLVEANLEHPTAAVHRLTGWAVEAGVELDSLAVSRASLEDVYLSLTDVDRGPAPGVGGDDE